MEGLKKRLLSKEAVLRKRPKQAAPEVKVGVGGGSPGSQPPCLPQGHPDIRSHPKRKPGGRAPPKEACQVSETIKRQGKHPGSEEEGGEAWEGGRKRRYRGGGRTEPDAGAFTRSGVHLLH